MPTELVKPPRDFGKEMIATSLSNTIRELFALRSALISHMDDDSFKDLQNSVSTLANQIKVGVAQSDCFEFDPDAFMQVVFNPGKYRKVDP